MLTILGGLAEFERSLILTKTGEGRARAMARGVKFGRKHKLTPHQQQEAKRRRDAGESLSEIGRLFGVNYQTIGRLDGPRRQVLLPLAGFSRPGKANTYVPILLTLWRITQTTGDSYVRVRCDEVRQVREEYLQGARTEFEGRARLQNDFGTVHIL